jgi:hypothetical protein
MSEKMELIAFGSLWSAAKETAERKRKTGRKRRIALPGGTRGFIWLDLILFHALCQATIGRLV